MSLERRRKSEKMVTNLRWLALVAAALLLEDRATATAFVIGASIVFAYNLLGSIVCSSPTAYARTRPYLGHILRVFDIIVITAAVPMFSNEWGNFRLLYVPVIISAGMVEGDWTAFAVAAVSLAASTTIGALFPAGGGQWAIYGVAANLLLFTLAAVFGIYLSNESDRDERNRLNARRLAIFRDMGAALSNPNCTDHMAHLLASVAVELTGIRRCVVVVNDPESGEPRVRCVRGYRTEEIDSTGQPKRGEADTAGRHTVPLTAQNETLGYVRLDPEATEERVASAEIDFLVTLATQAAISIRNARRSGEVRRRAETDSLTGLANRWTLNTKAETELRRAQRYGANVSLCMCDLDGFKGINDTRGHVTADSVLAAIGTALREEIRPGDVAARFGGDEFVVMFVNSTHEQAVMAAERIRAIMDEVGTRVLDGDDQSHLTVSVGVACFPDDAADFDGLVRCADDRMFVAKAQGKDRVVAQDEGSLRIAN